ncbi:hypothetical protein BHQ23_27585 [Mycobacterium gordonae]|uniref:Uncharacterized protein n=1 Tax=Mycobacterium gordonae TaxID=1778 RepID=A0A1X1XCP8_MYCGO|nr:hypothetical protein BHQ23_27585 [Mycobacterium gordonae]ORV96428.1 hypothetical protein AWC08_00220 [Mycobacterium gordonae]
MAVSCSSHASTPSTATVNVDSSSMFSYAGADGLTVSGAAGVAAPGVRVTITAKTQPQVKVVDQLTYLGRSVDIVIGENAQPKAPVTVSIPTPNGLDQTVPTAVGVTERDGKPEFLEVINRAGTLSTTLTHLSPVDFFHIDFARFAKGVTDAIGTVLTGQSTKSPECVEKSIDVDGVTLKANRTKNESGGNLDAVWPCLRFEHGQILLDLHANGNRAWLTRSQPDVGTGALSALDSHAATASGFISTLYNLGKRRSTGTLMPSTTLTYSFSPDNPPTRAEVKVDPGLMLTSALVYELTALLDITGASTGDKLEKVPGAYDCLLGAADTLDTAKKAFIDNFLSAFHTILGCMSEVVPGPAAFLLNIFAGGATIVSGLLTSAWNEATNNNHGIIIINRIGGSTQVINEVAVSADGQPLNGYHEVGGSETVADCEPSLAAVNKNIYRCYPTAAGADVCWPAASLQLLCMDDPWKKQLRRVSISAPLAPVDPPQQAWPVALQLDDGTQCRLRNGGAWGSRDDDYRGAYGCDAHGEEGYVLTPYDVYPIDRSAPMWTVKTGDLATYGGALPPPVTHTVAKAWFASK